MKTVIKGFTLAELMIVITIISILITLSYPSYVSFIRKADRTEAKVELLDWANRQAVWRADNISYNDGINPVDDDNYVYTIVSTATSFTLTATAQGDQADDEEDGISCSSLTINHAGIQGPSGYLECWG